MPWCDRAIAYSPPTVHRDVEGDTCGAATVWQTGDVVTSYFVAWTFRFRGKTTRLLALVDCFLKEPDRGLAAPYLARQSGIAMYDTVRMLNQTPELFVKLPGRGDGITRYRLASSVAARGEQGIEAWVAGQARRESWIYYALLTMALLLFVVAVLAVAPALF